MLVGASVSYLVDMLAAFLIPGLDKQIHTFTSVVPAIAEPWMVVYLLVIGVKAVKPARRILAAQMASQPARDTPRVARKRSPACGASPVGVPRPGFLHFAKRRIASLFQAEAPLTAP